ncbi:unnamed protein product [Linum trigynum]|uniref:Sialate O-acetylesterase domain-containing protein n=1 Tax=Linum trigynum TaxID=586398 RepID=A0AAV2FCM1_9ROSI
MEIPCFAIAFSLLFLHHAPLPSSAVPDSIFILAGQSNMAGRGGVHNNTATGALHWDGIVPAQCQPNPSILRFSKDLVWVPAHEPLHADIDSTKTNGIGPGMPFANAVLTQDPDSVGAVGLVPCAVGGTTMNQWAKGGALYGEMVRRATAAVEAGGGNLRGLIWYQGESDTNSRQDAEEYRGRLETLFYHVRQDLQLPALPIIQVALASAEGPYKETVREAQLGISIPNLVTVDADGLPIQRDGLHLTTASQVELGHMLANAFLKTNFLSSPIRTSRGSGVEGSSSNSPASSGVLTVPLLMSALVFSLNFMIMAYSVEL